MSKKSKNKIKDESQLKSFEEILELTENANKELKKLCNEMLGIAAEVKKEYGELDEDILNELSGSVTHIHQDSPFLDEIFKGDAWKKVLKTVPKPVNKNKEKKDG
tara:strand:+ start:202 stop:516 length:315 start_codon:yes stop_codon:yes gene_type:complete